VRHLVVGSFVRIELGGIQIVQFVEFDSDSKASIQSIFLLQEVLHHSDVRAGEDKLNVSKPVINDALKNGINCCGLIHHLQIGVFVNDDNHFLRQRVKIGKNIL